MAEPEAHGPIDYVVLEFPVGNLRGEAAAALVDLIDRGLVRLYDLLVVGKGEDGTVAAIEIGEDVASALGLGDLAGATSGLLGDEDVLSVGEAMEPGTVAAVIVYENLWAIPFVAATRRAGGEMIATGRIPAQDVMDLLDSLESAG